ncbi:MAG: hypothetical protein HQL50_04220 [Magnetococcales bacterium]|nr:hypothetical protein [Magnetococcales bacterium]
MKATQRLLIILLAIFLTACIAPEPVSQNLPRLRVQFDGTGWNGIAIAQENRCRADGGRGLSPSFKVSRLPVGTNAILVRYNNEDNRKLENGGLGEIGFKVDMEETSAVTVAIPEGTDTLPDSVWIEIHNRWGDMQGIGYRAPCSGGKGDRYSASVLALKTFRQTGVPPKILAQGSIFLGRW